MSTTKELINRLIVVLLLLCCMLLVLDIFINPGAYQWDFKVYYYSAKAALAGLNPYDMNILSQIAQCELRLGFVYPPLTVWFFQLFAIMDYHTAFYSFLILKLLSLIGLIYIWRDMILEKRVDPLFYFFCLLAFDGAIYIDIITGNISTLEQVIIWVAFYFFMRHNLALFCILINIAAAFKVTPILFLCILLFNKNKDRYLYFFGSWFLFSLILLASYMLDPSLFTNFAYSAVNRLKARGTINPSTSAFLNDSFHLLDEITGIKVPQNLQFIVYIIIVALIIFVTWLAYKKLKSFQIEGTEKIAILLCCLVYALILPRFKDYSYSLLLVPTYFLISRDKYSRAYPYLFILTILPSRHITLPRFHVIFSLVKEYYPLILAYLAWILYLFEIFVSRKKPINQITHNS